MKYLKKIVAILLLSTLLFNIVGYRFLFNHFEQKSIAAIEKKIDAFTYNANELKEVSIPLNMPYCSDKQMENVNGEVVINGLHYQYVKRKIENNILHLWCLPNTQKNNLIAVKNDIAKSNNQQPNQSRNTILIKLFQTEFIPLQTTKIISHFMVQKTVIVANNFLCVSQFKPADAAKPPEFSC